MRYIADHIADNAAIPWLTWVALGACHAPHQAPFWLRRHVANALGLDRDAVRVVSTDVGGGFGARASEYPEVMVTAALAMRLSRPVRFVESRTETQTNLTHGRAQVQHVELGARRDGTITGMRVRVSAPIRSAISSRK